MLRTRTLIAAGAAVLLLTGSATSGAQNVAARPVPYVIPLSFHPVPVPVAPATGRLQMPIISGRNSFEHDWRGTSNAIRRMLEDTGRFEVHVTEDFRGASARTLTRCDGVLINYLGRWNHGDPAEQRWGAAEEQALFGFVRSGHGVVVYHASLIMGAPRWPEFERMAGGTMRMTPPQSRRNPADAFLVHIVDRNHPIMQGMRDYVGTADYGKGRVLGFALGHGPDTLQYDGVQSLLIGGTERAASGRATLPRKEKAMAHLEEGR